MLNEQDYLLVQADLRKNRRDPSTHPTLALIAHYLRNLFGVRHVRNLLGLAAPGYFASRPLFLDLNTIHQKVNWPALKGRNLIGVIDKAGEWDGTPGPESWLNPNLPPSCQGAADAGLSYSAFLFAQNGAEWINRQMTQKGVSDIFDLATTDDQRMANLLHLTNGVPDYPEFYIIVRQWAIGSGWTTDPEWLKSAHFRKIDKWVIDIERWWRNYNEYLDYIKGNRTKAQVTVIDAPWIAFSNANLVEKLVWAMSHGYLPAADIEIVDYSGKWVIDGYGLTYLATFLQNKSTWPAIWYWANVPALTLETLVSVQLASIPDSWKDSATFKNAMFGQIIRLLQVGRATLPEITSLTGTPSEVDVDLYVGPDDVKTWLNILPAPPAPPPVPVPPPPPVPADPTLKDILAELKVIEGKVDALAANSNAIATKLEKLGGVFTDYNK